ncbi:hypothetical protein JCM10213_007439 [Rhodosporidiobolus nylandii]
MAAPAASTSTSGGAPAPPKPPAAALRALKTAVLTEHFRFSPETFAKGGMDLANRTMYAATAMVERSLQKLVDDGVEGFEEEEVQRGIYALETLLEDAIDTQFDLFEIFVLRNTFSFADDLLPYLVLPHQATLEPSLRDADAPTLEEYEEELRMYEEELQKERELAAAEIFVMAKEAKVREQAELVGYLKQPGKLPTAPTGDSRIPILSAQLSSLLSHLSALSSTPSAFAPRPPKPEDDDDATPSWAANRAAFVNWAAAAKAAASGASTEMGHRRGEDPAVGAVQKGMEGKGRQGDAKALLGAMKSQ